MRRFALRAPIVLACTAPLCHPSCYLPLSRISQQDAAVWGAPALSGSSLTRHLRSNPLTRVSPTGTLYCDCEHNYLLVGSLIEHASKLPFQRYMAARCVALRV